jgi:hypothetical protein
MPGILQGWFGPFPQTMQAQDVDSNGNVYYGEASRGTTKSRPRWSIFMNSTYGTAGAYIIQFPVDPATGLGSDQPVFNWSHATDGTYTYASLGCPANISP